MLTVDEVNQAWANGISENDPRQNEQLKPLASYWEVLPSGTFAGTCLMVIEA